MKTDIIPIGNSKGIRIPKAIIEQCGFGESVEIVVDKRSLILRSSIQLRGGWDDAFKAMAAKEDDTALESTSTHFDEGDWQW